MAIAINKSGARKVPKNADDAFWDLEALKLDLMGSEWFRKYAIQDSSWSGDSGMKALKFRDDQWNSARGHRLIAACARMYDSRNGGRDERSNF